jgi:preprotein translocase subunit SecE
MNKLTQFVQESWHEVTKEVTWTKRDELFSSASIVLIASVIFALVVGLMDLGIDNALQLLYNSI